MKVNTAQLYVIKYNAYYGHNYQYGLEPFELKNGCRTLYAKYMTCTLPDGVVCVDGKLVSEYGNKEISIGDCMFASKLVDQEGDSCGYILPGQPVTREYMKVVLDEDKMAFERRYRDATVDLLEQFYGCKAYDRERNCSTETGKIKDGEFIIHIDYREGFPSYNGRFYEYTVSIEQTGLDDFCEHIAKRKYYLYR